MRIVIAVLLRSYEVSFAPNEDGSAMFKDMKDVFTATPGKCQLLFDKRSRS